MEQQHKTKSMVEAAVLSAMTVILSFAGLYIPFLGVFITFIWPVPIVILVTRHGLPWGIMATVVSGLMVMMFSGPISAITIAFGFGLTGIALGYALKKDYSPGTVIFFTAAASFVSKVLIIALTMAIMDINPIQEQLKVMEQAMHSSVRFYRTMGIKMDDLAMTQQMFDRLLEQMRIIVPASFILASLFDGGLNYLVAKSFLKRLGHPVKQIPPFSTWQISQGFAIGLAIALIAAYTGQMYGGKSWEAIIANVQLVFLMLFSVQGLAVALFYMKRFYRSRVWQGLMVLFVLFNPLLLQLLSFLGVIDSFVDFRKLKISE